MNKHAVHQSSNRDDWCTPANVGRLVDKFGVKGIGLDPCSNEQSLLLAKTSWRLLRDGDSLMRSKRDWLGHGLVYVNPPYGRGVGDWLDRCLTVAEDGSENDEAIALVAARTDTAWWHDFCVPSISSAVCFVRGRLTFLGAPSPAPFPSALVYWGRRAFRFADVFSTIGAVWM